MFNKTLLLSFFLIQLNHNGEHRDMLDVCLSNQRVYTCHFKTCSFYRLFFFISILKSQSVSALRLLKDTAGLKITFLCCYVR